MATHLCVFCSNDASASLGGRGFVAKISDFGLSRSMEHKSKVVTKTYGTLTHMPPELLEHGITSKAADVYSFGVLLWQVSTGLMVQVHLLLVQHLHVLVHSRWLCTGCGSISQLVNGQVCSSAEG